MALATTGRFSSRGMDDRLLDILQRAAAAFPLKVEAFSGVAGRSTGTKNHPAGRAVDINIYGADGRKLPNLRSGSSFRTYEQFAQLAREIQQQLYPELNDRFRWGGYFRQGTSFDQMHFDIGGGGMAYGSWEDGLNGAGIAELERISGTRPSSIGMASPRYRRGNFADLQMMQPGPTPPADIPSIATGAPINLLDRAMSTDAANAEPAPGIPLPKSRPLDQNKLLRRGSTGAEVAALQRHLYDRGIYSGEIDGKFGPQTQRAVQAFQRANDIETDGIVGPITRSYINPPPAPRPRPPSAAAPLPPLNGTGMPSIAPPGPPLPPLNGLGTPGPRPAPPQAVSPQVAAAVNASPLARGAPLRAPAPTPPPLPALSGIKAPRPAPPPQTGPQVPSTTAPASLSPLLPLPPLSGPGPSIAPSPPPPRPAAPVGPARPAVGPPPLAMIPSIRDLIAPTVAAPAVPDKVAPITQQPFMQAVAPAAASAGGGFRSFMANFFKMI